MQPSTTQEVTIVMTIKKIAKRKKKLLKIAKINLNPVQ